MSSTTSLKKYSNLETSRFQITLLTFKYRRNKKVHEGLSYLDRRMNLKIKAGSTRTSHRAQKEISLHTENHLEEINNLR